MINFNPLRSLPTGGGLPGTEMTALSLAPLALAGAGGSAVLPWSQTDFTHLVPGQNPSGVLPGGWPGLGRFANTPAVWTGNLASWMKGTAMMFARGQGGERTANNPGPGGAAARPPDDDGGGESTSPAGWLKNIGSRMASWFGRGPKKGQAAIAGSDLILKPKIGESALLAPAAQKEVDLRTDSVVYPGNGVRLMKNGAASFPERYRMMEGARYSINLQTLIFHSDETGWKTARLLARRAGEGVRVRVIYDWISSADSDRAIFKLMEDAGVELHAFNTPLDYQWHMASQREFAEHTDRAFKDFWEMANSTDISEVDEWIAEKGESDFAYWRERNANTLARIKEYPPLLHKLNNRWHMKLLVVDGQEAMIGGMNIGSEYANGGSTYRDRSLGDRSFSAQAFRDTDVKVEGPVVTRVNEIFAVNWRYAGGGDNESILSENPPPHPVGGINARFISHMPREKKDRNIEEWYYQMLANAKSTAYFTNAYFLPTPEFCDALIAAARRGVDVRILTNSVGTNDLPILTQGGQFYYRKLLEGGVRIYEFRKDNPGNFTTLHAKTAVFDGEVSTVGSHNLDARSFSINSEDTVVIHDRPFGLEMHRVFQQDLASSNEVALSDIRAQTPADRMAQWFAGQVLKDLL